MWACVFRAKHLQVGNHFSRQTHVGHSFFTRKQNRSPRWSLLVFITLEAKLQMGDSGGHGETDSVSAPLKTSPRVSRELVFLPPNNAFRLDASPRERWAKFKVQSSFYRHLPFVPPLPPHIQNTIGPGMQLLQAHRHFKANRLHPAAVKKAGLVCLYW